MTTRRPAATPAAPAPETVVAARQWVLSSGFDDVISITSTGRLRAYGLEFDPDALLAMTSDEALDLLTSAAIRAELGDPEEFDEP